jgi:hypothetical protein
MTSLVRSKLYSSINLFHQPVQIVTKRYVFTNSAGKIYVRVQVGSVQENETFLSNDGYLLQSLNYIV